MSEERIDDLLAEWEEQLEMGHPTSAEELGKDYPELVPALKEAIAQLKEAGWMDAVAQEGGSNSAADGSGHRTSGGAEHAAPLIGGRYRFDKMIGEGGFGQVWKGFDVELQRTVAVKVLKESRRIEASDTKAFGGEAQTGAQLKHPGFVPVHDVVHDGQHSAIISEFIQGMDLSQRMLRSRPSIREAVQIVAQAARHLAYAHRKGFIHRDIKPANLLLDQQNKVYITDLGLAVTDEEIRRQGVSICGTLNYMSPEQLRGDNTTLGVQADVYSLGVVLYELLTGKPPFQSAVSQEVVAGVLERQPPPVRTLKKDVPKEVERICLRCLAKMPDERYPGMDALAGDLECWLQRGSLRTLVEKVLLWVGGTSGLVAVALILIGLFINSGSQSQEADPSLKPTQEAEPPSPKRTTPAVMWEMAAEVKLGLENHDQNQVYCLAFSPDGRTLASGQVLFDPRNVKTLTDCQLCVWNLETNLIDFSVVGLPFEPRSIAFHPDGTTIAAVGQMGVDFAIIDTALRDKTLIKDHGPLGTKQLAYSPDGKTLAVTTEDEKGLAIGLWTLVPQTTRSVVQFPATEFGDTGRLTGIVYTPDGTRLFISNETNRYIRVYNILTNQKARWCLPDDGDEIGTGSIVVTPDGKNIISSHPLNSRGIGHRSTIIIWDTKTGEIVSNFEASGHRWMINSMAINPDGSILATACEDKTVILWDLKERTKLCTLKGHTGDIMSVAFSPDGRTVATGSGHGQWLSGDGTIKLWKPRP